MSVKLHKIKRSVVLTHRDREAEKIALGESIIALDPNSHHHHYFKMKALMRDVDLRKISL